MHGDVFVVDAAAFADFHQVAGADEKTVHEKWRGIGIRIEDDILVTKDGHKVLTDKLARSADEIEAFMASR